MVVSTFSIDHAIPREFNASDNPAASAEASALLTRLLGWFDVEFHLFDGATGALVHCAFDQGARDWDLRGEICRAVAAAGRAEIIEEEPPLVVLAIPVRLANGASWVAVGTFVTSHAVAANQLGQSAQLLGSECDDAASWIARQTCWSPEALRRMGQMATERLSADERQKNLEREVDDLSLHLSTSYEEISLLYRLTQNLKLSSSKEELASLAIGWLADVLPAESLALQLNSSTSADGEEAAPAFFTFGPCPIDDEQLPRLVEHFGQMAMQRPLVVNRQASERADWPWPTIRQLVVVPLAEGDRVFGWLFAFNHIAGAEFGTVEASMLSSVGAILGIHNANAELYQQQRETFAGVIRALTSAIDAKDPYTCGHSDRVARVSVRLAEELGCERKLIDTIYLSGLLHDVGKIGIDDNVLRKPGKLTEAEFEHIKTHAEIGYRILSDIKQLDDVLPVVLHHHEQWDGKGYPHGLAGEAIPLLARIVAVADSFDAMGSDRPYREGMGDEKLDSIMRAGAGQQWDAAVVDAFFRARQDVREIAKRKVKSVSLDLRERL